MNAWAFKVIAPEERSFQGNFGYHDDLENYYSYDNRVANSKQVAIGDFVVLLGVDFLIGTATLEQIIPNKGTKATQTCPNCGLVKVDLRAKKAPRWRCKSCKHEFDKPVRKEIEVDEFRAIYRDSWAPIDLPLRSETLSKCYVGKDVQNAIRRLDLAKVRSALGSHKVVLASKQALSEIPGGHVLRQTRSRIGQDAFRKRQLERFGIRCAITGPHPAAALDAAHLYAYSTTSHHDLHGGLLLRKDLHALFDRGLLTIDSKSWTVELHQSIRSFPQLHGFHGTKLQLTAELLPNPAYVEAHRNKWIKHKAPTVIDYVQQPPNEAAGPAAELHDER